METKDPISFCSLPSENDENGSSRWLSFTVMLKYPWGGSDNIICYVSIKYNQIIVTNFSVSQQHNWILRVLLMFIPCLCICLRSLRSSKLLILLWKPLLKKYMQYVYFTQSFTENKLKNGIIISKITNGAHFIQQLKATETFDMFIKWCVASLIVEMELNCNSWIVLCC